MIKILGALFSLTFLIHFMASSSAACSCVRSSPQDYFQRADAVFTGKAIKIDGRDTTFEVERSWKLVDTNQIIVRDAGEDSCKSGYGVGYKYLIYAYRHDGILYTHMCGGTEMLEQAGEQLAFLQGKSAIALTGKPGVNNEVTHQNYFKVILISCLIVMLFLGIGLFVSKIRKLSA